MRELTWELVILIKTLTYILRRISETGTHDTDMLARAPSPCQTSPGQGARKNMDFQSENELHSMNQRFIGSWAIRNYNGLVLKCGLADTSAHLKVRAGGDMWAYT